MTVNAWGADDPIPYDKGGTATATASTGDIIYASATNTLAKLAAGTDSHVLTVATDVPNWEAASGGSSGWTPLAQATASASSSVNFDNTYITTTYDVYIVKWFNLRPATDSTFEMLYSTDNGSSMESTNYNCRTLSKQSTTATDTSSEFQCHTNNMESDSTEGVAIATFWLANPAASGTRTTCLSQIGYNQSTTARDICKAYAKHAATEAHNYIRFQFSTGNIATGTAYLFGFTKP